MKYFSIVGIGTIVLLTSVPFLSQIPLIANVGQSGVALAQNVQAKNQVQLRLDADKKVIKQVQGKQQISWEALQGKTLVQPGDVLRYTVTAANNSSTGVKNLTINQPIPVGMVYVLNSATSNGDKSVNITYSIDGGHSFVEQPTVKTTLANGKIETKPAPATIYTHIRWNVKTLFPAKRTVKGTYLVQVR